MRTLEAYKQLTPAPDGVTREFPEFLAATYQPSGAGVISSDGI